MRGIGEGTSRALRRESRSALAWAAQTRRRYRPSVRCRRARLEYLRVTTARSGTVRAERSNKSSAQPTRQDLYGWPGLANALQARRDVTGPPSEGRARPGRPSRPLLEAAVEKARRRSCGRRPRARRGRRVFMRSKPHVPSAGRGRCRSAASARPAEAGQAATSRRAAALTARGFDNPESSRRQRGRRPETAASALAAALARAARAQSRHIARGAQHVGRGMHGLAEGSAPLPERGGGPGRKPRGPGLRANRRRDRRRAPASSARAGRPARLARAGREAQCGLGVASRGRARAGQTRRAPLRRTALRTRRSRSVLVDESVSSTRMAPAWSMSDTLADSSGRASARAWAPEMGPARRESTCGEPSPWRRRCWTRKPSSLVAAPPTIATVRSPDFFSAAAA